MNLSKKTLALLTAGAMAASMVTPAFAVNSQNGGISDINPDDNTTGGYTYQAPTAPMAVDDNIITATAHRAASPVLGMLGVNATSGFGMINGGAPADLAAAQECAAMGIWGSSLNENPDPYYWNYFYNFYAAENELELSDDALINANVAASPVAADGNLIEEYGNISVSLYTRPQIAVGVASTGGGSDTNGYDAQLATINGFTSESPYYLEGDETYAPKLVSYQTRTIENMIASVYALADAITEVEEETGKTTRYGDVQAIAADYETYIYGIISYVQAELAANNLEQKTFAFVTAINEDGTFTIGGADYNSATSLGRAYEYCIAAATPMTTETKTVTLEELLQANVIITLNNSNLNATAMQEAGVNGASYDGVLITNNPASLYGITMNSVENAVGYAYVIGSMYSDVIDIDPVELCAYFYQHFEHISDLDSLATVVLTNFSDTILPEGVSATLSSNYSAAAVEEKLVKGMNYYTLNETDFDAEQFLDSGIDEWVPNYEIGIGANVDPYADVFSDVDPEEWYYEYVVWALKNNVTAGMGDGTFGVDVACTRAHIVTFLWNRAGQPVVEGTSTFSDVNEGDWYYNAVLWAIENNVTAGRGDGTFGADASCTREEAVTFLWNYMGKAEVADATVSFTDVDQDAWYFTSVAWAVANNITAGMGDGTFGVATPCTRAQIVTFLSKLPA